MHRPQPRCADNLSEFLHGQSAPITLPVNGRTGALRGWSRPASSSAAVNGHLHLLALRDALERHLAGENVSTTTQNEPAIAA